MAKGDGGIQRLEGGRWRIFVSFGNDPVTGERQRITRVISGTKAEARKVRDEIKREHENGLRIDAENVKFRDFSTAWLEGKLSSGAIGMSRYRTERALVDAMNSHIGNMALTDITPQVVEKLYSVIRAEKTEKNGYYSGTSMNMLHTCLKQVLKKAVMQDLLLRNPCDRVDAPKKNAPERKALSSDECARLVRALDDAERAAYAEMAGKEARQAARGNDADRTYLRGMNTVSEATGVRIAIATGMRRGEVFGLTWGSVDFDRFRILVRKTLTVDGFLKEPKSRAGVRDVAVDEKTARHIAEWKSRQALELSKLGIRQTEETPVCCSETGGFLDLHNVERWWRRFRVEAGFPSLKLHELRHTQATLLLANGVDVKTVQSRMGHSNASITLNWYAHALPENDQKAAQLMGNLFNAERTKGRIIRLRTA